MPHFQSQFDVPVKYRAPAIARSRAIDQCREATRETVDMLTRQVTLCLRFGALNHCILGGGPLWHVISQRLVQLFEASLLMAIRSLSCSVPRPPSGMANPIKMLKVVKAFAFFDNRDFNDSGIACLRNP